MNPEDEEIYEGFGQSEIIDVNEIMEKHTEKWYNESLSLVNDSLVRLGVFQGVFHWHKHDREDELFYVISGKLLLDLPHGTLELGPNQAYTVPRNIKHRTRAVEKTVVIMVEGATVRAAGDP